MPFFQHYLNFLFNAKGNYFMQDKIEFLKPFIEIEEINVFETKKYQKTQLIKCESLLTIPKILFSA